MTFHFFIRAIMETWAIYLIAGIVVVTISMLRHNIKRRRRDLQKEAERQAALRAAREAEARRQREMGQDVKKSEARSSLGSRVPLPKPVDTTFTGAASPHNIARWETEMHEIGRQVMGKIDSKMIALQTLTAESNRAANRLELLLEQIERILQHMKNAQTVTQEFETDPEVPAPPQGENAENSENREVPIVKEDVPTPTVLRDVERAVNNDGGSFADILNDLESEIEELENMEILPGVSSASQNVPSATILKAETVSEYQAEYRAEYQKMSGEAVSAAPSVTETNRRGDILSLNSGVRSEERPSRPPLPRSTSPGALSLESLYDNGLADRAGEKLFAVAGMTPSGTLRETVKFPVAPSAITEPKRETHRDLRKQVEMMADYGHSSREIAQSLEITAGEVDLILSLRD